MLKLIGRRSTPEMLTEIPAEEYAAVLDACAEDLLWEAGVGEPPVDALVVAERLGLAVARDAGMPHRGRFLRPAAYDGGSGQGTILVSPDPRPERTQWTVAHEIGESVAHRVFAAWGTGGEVPRDRERVANHLASCLLLPRAWFAEDGLRLEWDLFALKRRYRSASHELIARRMLEMSPPVIITVCDQGRVAWRRSNLLARPPRLAVTEAAVWREAREAALATASESATYARAGGLSAHGCVGAVQCWAIHEPPWHREIIRTELSDI